jgi:hypothetical protein
MKTFLTRTIKLTVLAEGDTLFGESATTVEIVDDSAGEFIEVEQQIDGCGKIRISPEEWPELRLAIDSMIAGCGEVPTE